jgi:hypothetical protein
MISKKTEGGEMKMREEMKKKKKKHILLHLFFVCQNSMPTPVRSQEHNHSFMSIPHVSIRTTSDERTIEKERKKVLSNVHIVFS